MDPDEDGGDEEGDTQDDGPNQRGASPASPSESYGLAASNSGAGLGDVAGGVVGILGGGGLGSTSAGAGTTQAHPGTPGTAGTLASVMVTPAQRAIILVISSLLEGLLLVVVARNYIRWRVAAPVETTDLP